MSSTLTLFTEFKIDDDMMLKNRMVLAPLTRVRCGRTFTPNQTVVDYYTQRASAGLLISEGTLISKQATGWAGAAAIYEPHHVEGWKKVTKSVHDAGGLIFCQLWHMGRTASSVFFGIHPVSASAISAVGQVTDWDRTKVSYQTPRALETHEIADVVEQYRVAAFNAKEAGFDGVEIHAANGYFLDQFLQSCSNARTDKYGGSFENRFRIVEEVLAAVLTAFPSKHVGIRLTPNGSFGSMGSADNFEAFTHYITRVNEYNLAFLHIPDGQLFGLHSLCKHFKLADARKLFDNAIIGNSGYEKLTAEGAINTGAADLIAFGRLWISNPDLVERFKHGWPTAPPGDRAIWFDYPNFPDGDPSIGYSDFPVFQPAEEDK